LGRQWAQTFQTNPQRALSLLSAEENNLTHALHLARRHERWSDVQGILEGLKRLLTTQGRWVEWEQLLADVNTVVTDADGKPLSGREVLWVALLEHHQHIAHARRDFEAEETILRQLEEYYEHIEDNDQQAVALHNLGNIAFERHQFREAGRWYRQSMTIKECIGDVPGQAITLYQLGRIAEERRQFKEAGRWYQQSLTLEKRIRNASGQAMTLHRLGRIAEKRRQFAEAERWYRQSLAIKERLSDEQGQAMTLHQLGSIAEEQGQFVEAERCYHRAIAIFERLGDIDGHTNTRRRLERIVQQRGRVAEPLPGLVEALKSANADLRVAAARALGEVPPSSASQAAIDALKGAIQDADAEVRRAAAGALQRLLPQTLYEQLLSTIETARREGYNPYIAGGPVHEDRMFFGREAVLAAILNTIHNNSVLIYGERRIGKTSILHKLRRALQQRDDAPGAFFPVFVSLQGVSEGEFFATLVERILDVCPHPPGDTLRYYSGSTSYSYASFQRDMQRVTQYLVGTSPRPPKIVLLLDEVDTFNDYSLTTNLRLRDLFTGPLHPYFTAVMSGYALRETWPTQASPPFNYLSQRIKIEPLDAATARQLIEEPVRGWYRYETGAVGRILALSELRPFLIQKFCLEAVNRMLQQGRQQILLEDVEAAAVIVEALKASLHPQADGVKDLSPEQRRMVELEQANATLQARIAELEARLNTLAQRR